MNVLLLSALVEGVRSHGAVTSPKPRNAIDGAVHPWNSTVPSTATMPFMFYCAHPDAESDDPRKVTGSNGQACFFFNNGCDISCDECDGQTGQVVHPQMKWTGAGPRPPWDGKGWVPENINQTGKRPDGECSGLPPPWMTSTRPPSDADCCRQAAFGSPSARSPSARQPSATRATAP